jgi:tetratricopeptide (TPR) repeat protein
MFYSKSQEKKQLTVPKQLGKFIADFQNSFGYSVELLEIFTISGMSGIGKSYLVDRIKEAYKHKSEIYLIQVNLAQLNSPGTPIELMRRIDSELQHKSEEVPKGEWKTWSTFYVDYKKYQDTLSQLSSKPINPNEPIKEDQLNTVRELARSGGNVLGTMIPIPGVSPILGEAAKACVDLSTTILHIKDELLNKHQVTKEDEALQKLLLTPLVTLTPKFVETLIKILKTKYSIILILENYEKLGQNKEDKKNFENWLYWFCELINETEVNFDQQKKPKIRIIISGQRQLTEQENWGDFKEERKILHEYNLHRFSKEETYQYLSEKLVNKSENIIFLSKEIDEIYQFTKGHASFLEWICSKKNDDKKPDYSDGSRITANKLLHNLKPIQRYIVQVVSCCRWFDKHIIQELFNEHDQVSNELAEALIDIDQLTDWLTQESFINFKEDRFYFDELARQVFRRLLFQSDRERFYESHSRLANYFKKKADRIEPLYSPFTKYEDEEWCEYMGEFLYHSCFAHKEDFQRKFLEHLFCSIYLRQNKLVENSFNRIVEEAAIEKHPLLQNATRSFLKSLSFIVKYKWVAFELNRRTAYGKYRSYIENLSQLCGRLVDLLDEGIGKFAVLEFITRNCNSNDLQQWIKQLFEQAVKSASKTDPDLSSQLFIQCVYYSDQVRCSSQEHQEYALKCYDKALEYKPDDANTWFKKGEILKQQKDYQKAVTQYEKALDIQPYDHRYWLSKGDALDSLGENVSEADTEGAHHSLCYKRMLYYQRAIDCYKEADAFRTGIKEIQERITKVTIKLNELLAGLGRVVQGQSLTLPEESKDRKNDYRDLERQGTIHRNKRSSEELKAAISFYNRVIRLQPSYPLGWYHRGLTFTLLCENKLCEIDLKQSNNLNTSQVAEWYEKAVQDYKKALELQPSLEWALFDLGKTYRYWAFNQEKSDDKERVTPFREQALAYFDRAIQIDSDYKEAWYYRGLVLHELGRDEEAIASYDKVLELIQNIGRDHSDDLEKYIWQDRGSAFSTLRLWEEALASYDKSKRLFEQLLQEESDPGQREELKIKYSKVCYGCGLAEIEIEAYDLAVEDFNLAIQYNPQYFEAFCKKIDCHDQLHQLGAALSCLEEIAFKFPAQYRKALDHNGASFANLAKRLCANPTMATSH